MPKVLLKCSFIKKSFLSVLKKRQNVIPCWSNESLKHSFLFLWVQCYDSWSFKSLPNPLTFTGEGQIKKKNYKFTCMRAYPAKTIWISKCIAIYAHSAWDQNTVSGLKISIFLTKKARGWKEDCMLSTIKHNICHAVNILQTPLQETFWESTYKVVSYKLTRVESSTKKPTFDATSPC